MSTLIQHSSQSNEWFTPAEYIESARLVMGSIDLDPASCAEANQTVKAGRYFTEADDGLSRHWFGNVWLNPPYGGLAGPFSEYLVKEYEASRIKAATLLLNSNTDRRYIQPLIKRFSVCFTEGRVDFVEPVERAEARRHAARKTIERCTRLLDNLYTPDRNKIYAQMKRAQAKAKRPDGPATGQVFIYMGPSSVRFEQVFAQYGATGRLVRSLV